jgi:serine/threonine protein kinase
MHPHPPAVSAVLAHQVLLEIASALQYLHDSAQLVHGDLKMDNVLLKVGERG